MPGMIPLAVVRAVSQLIEEFTMKPPVVPVDERRVPSAGDDIYVDDWLFVKPLVLLAGEAVVQHVHEYDHVTLVAAGTVRAWIEDQDQGEVTAPQVVRVAAGARHKFLAVTPVVLYCIHNLRGEGYPAIKER